jgi:hypothetical protein
MKPLLLLDVDGVLNCFGSLWSPEYEKRHFDGGCARMSDDGHFTLRVRHETAGQLAELAAAFDVVWCTAWMDRAHPQFQKWLGLPEEPWPHIEFAGDWDRMLAAQEGGSSWKLGHVYAWLEKNAPDRPLVWLDDDLGQADYDWAAQRTRTASTLLLRTSPAIGVTRELTDAMLRFAQRCHVEDAFEEIVARSAELIATCHERRACPTCAAPRGFRCVRKGSMWGASPPLKHAHEARWSEEVPRR